MWSSEPVEVYLHCYKPQGFSMRGKKKNQQKNTPKGKQKHTPQYIMNISLPYCLLLLTSSNGKCRLISHCEQPAGLMDQQWHMCSCASLVSRCVSLSLLPRCPSKPSFVSIVVMSSIRQAKKRKHNICHCRSVCLTHCPPAPGSHQRPPMLMGFVLPSWEHLQFTLNQAFFHTVHFWGSKRGDYIWRSWFSSLTCFANT